MFASRDAIVSSTSGAANQPKMAPMAPKIRVPATVPKKEA
jgi:hypothetical protein